MTAQIRRTIDTGGGLLSMAVSGDGQWVVTGIPIQLWKLETGQLEKALRGLGQGGLAFTPKGDRIASAEWTGGARLWAVPSGDLKERLRIEAQRQVFGPSGFGPVAVNMPVASISFSRDGAWLATGATDSAIHLWDVGGERVAPSPARVLSGHAMTVTGVSFSPDGSRLASSSLDRTVRVWTLR